MSKKSRFAVAIGSTVLVGTLAVGAVAGAAGSSSGDGTGIGRQGLPHLTVQQKCDKQAEVAARVTSAKARIEQRIAALQHKKPANLQHRIERLRKLETRIDTRYSKYQTWVHAHCDAPSPGA